MNCRKCGIELNDSNWNDYRKNKHQHICSVCASIENKHYRYTRNYDVRSLELHRKKCLHSNGKNIYGINKRPYTKFCELCGNEDRTAYHHWNDVDLDIGMWLCHVCHSGVEFIEKKGIDTINAYFSMKKSIENETSVRRDIDDLLKYCIHMSKKERDYIKNRQYTSNNIHRINFSSITGIPKCYLVETLTYNSLVGSVSFYSTFGIYTENVKVIEEKI